MYTVYKHTNKANGKVYIGLTSLDIKRRWQGGYDNNPHFKRAIKRDGWDGFEHEIMAEGLNQSQACELERVLISFYHSTDPDKGYNIELGGNSNGKHSEQTKRKISESQKGRPLTEEHRRNLRVPHKCEFTDEQRAKRSARMKGNTYTLGFKHSEETKRRMSEARLGIRGKTVICSDGQIYKSVNLAAKAYGLSRHQVLNNCTGKTKKLYGSELTFSYQKEEIQNG